MSIFDRRPAKAGLSIIIVGLGKVGNALCEQLIKEGHNITVIDLDETRVQAVTDAYDIMGLVGNGASYQTLMEAGIETADLFIAVTDMDELNLLCCTVARRAGSCEAIARVRTPEYSDDIGYLKEKLDLAMIINPEKESAYVIARSLSLPAALAVKSFAGGRCELVRFNLPEGNVLAGRKIMDIAKNYAQDTLICAVERGEEVYIPGGDFELEGGDVVSFIATMSTARDFFRRIQIPNQTVKASMIIGGGKSAYYLAQLLHESGISVKIIEVDKARCEELSEILPDATIINADGTNEDILNEENIEDIDAFIPLTGLDEENILLTLHAADVSNAKVITKIKRNTFHNVINKLKLGSVVYPKYITAEIILAFVRGRTRAIGQNNIKTLYSLFNSKAEAAEFEAAASDEAIGVPLKDLRTRDNLLVAALIRSNRLIIPRGSDSIEEGDTVIIISKHLGLSCLDDILA